jgi:hypothetical protein
MRFVENMCLTVYISEREREREREREKKGGERAKVSIYDPQSSL